MNDKENTICWKVGDLVSHDADSKAKNMLMRVIRIQKNGMYVTKYAFPESHFLKEIKVYGSFEKIPRYKKHYMIIQYKNELKYLHDPQLFGIDVNMVRIYGID